MTHCLGSFCSAARPWRPGVTLGMPKAKTIVKTAILKLLRFVEASTLHLPTTCFTAASNTIQRSVLQQSNTLLGRREARSMKGEGRRINLHRNVPYSTTSVCTHSMVECDLRHFDHLPALGHRWIL